MFEQRRRTKQQPYNHNRPGGGGGKTLTYSYYDHGSTPGSPGGRHGHHLASNNRRSSSSSSISQRQNPMIRYAIITIGTVMIVIFGLNIVSGGGSGDGRSPITGISNNNIISSPTLPQNQQKRKQHVEHQPLGGVKSEGSASSNELKDGGGGSDNLESGGGELPQEHILGQNRLRGGTGRSGSALKHKGHRVHLSPHEGKIRELQEAVANIQLQIEKFITGETEADQRRLYSMQARADMYQRELDAEILKFEKEKEQLKALGVQMNEN